MGKKERALLSVSSVLSYGGEVSRRAAIVWTLLSLQGTRDERERTRRLSLFFPLTITSPVLSPTSLEDSIPHSFCLPPLEGRLIHHYLHRCTLSRWHTH